MFINPCILNLFIVNGDFFLYGDIGEYDSEKDCLNNRLLF